MKIVNVHIDSKGNGKVELEGFHGQGCSKVTEALKKIGSQSTETNKPEFYENSENLNTVSLG
jgi:hypothetical protein